MTSTLQQFSKVIDEASTCIYLIYYANVCYVCAFTCLITLVFFKIGGTEKPFT